MVATVVVKEMNGSPVVYTTVDNGSNKARYKTKDEVASDLNYPCVIPTSSYNYSFWKSHCLDISGTFTRVNNVRWYTDGTIGWTFGTGGGVFVGQRDAGDHGCPVANYQQATGVEGTTGHEIKDPTNGHAYYKGQTAPLANAQTFTSVSPCTIDTGNHDVAEKTKAVVTQLKLDTDAIQGVQPAETFTFMYDEI